MTTETTYGKDKNAAVAWVANGLRALTIVAIIGVYNKLEDFTIFAVKTEKDIEHLREKDQEHDQRFARNEQQFFMKPDELQVRHRFPHR